MSVNQIGLINQSIPIANLPENKLLRFELLNDQNQSIAYIKFNTGSSSYQSHEIKGIEVSDDRNRYIDISPAKYIKLLYVVRKDQFTNEVPIRCYQDSKEISLDYQFDIESNNLDKLAKLTIDLGKLHSNSKKLTSGSPIKIRLNHLNTECSFGFKPAPQQLIQFPGSETEHETATTNTPISYNFDKFHFEDGPNFRNVLLNFETKILKISKLIKKTNGDPVKSNLKFNEFNGSVLHILDDYLTKIDQLENPKSSSNTLSGNMNNNNLNANTAKVFEKLKKLSNPKELELGLANNKKIFEDDSKRYYDWISKLLSSGKSKDEKLLLKRKEFEISKIKYFTYLYDLSIHLFVNLIPLYNNVNSSEVADQLLKYLMEYTKFQKTLTNSISKTKEIKQLDLILKQNISPDMNKSGILFTHGGQGKLGWHKQWIVLDNGKLYEFMDWRAGKSQRFSNPIDITLSNIKTLDSNSNSSTNTSAVSITQKRKNCFRIITSKGDEHYYQAIDEFDRCNWIDSLFLAGQQINYSKPNGEKSNSKSKISQSIPNKNNTDSNGIKNNNNHNDNKTSRITTTATSALGSSVAKKSLTQAQNGHKSNSSLQTKQPERRVSSVTFDYLILVQNNDKSNLTCCDCGSSKDVEWISINLLCILCINCCGVHRNLGTYISKVRSLKLDSFRQNKELVLLLSKINNSSCNSIFEQLLPTNDKPQLIQPDCTPEQRMKFIRDKYVSKKYTNSDSDPDSVSSSLVQAVKSHNHYQIIKCFAMNVDPDFKVKKQITSSQQQVASSSPSSNDKMIIEFSIFEYALLHPTIHDPSTTPTTAIGSSASSIKSASSLTSNNEEILFETAELLLLNGSSLSPRIQTSLKLSNAALNYWQLKINKMHGNSQVQPQPQLTIPLPQPQIQPQSRSPLGSKTGKEKEKESSSKKFNLLMRRHKT